MSNVLARTKEGHVIKEIKNGVQITVPLPFKLTKSDIKGKAPLKEDILAIAWAFAAIGIIAIATPFVHLGPWVVIVALVASAVPLGLSKLFNENANEEQELDKQNSINRISRELLGPWLREEGFKKSEYLANNILTNGEAYTPQDNAWKVESIRLKFVNGKPIILAYDWS